MDIYSTLASRKHNSHFLKRYHTFILACCQANLSLPKGTYTESHHICPKASDLFPEYASFNENQWNKAVLTARQHYIAHWLLWKTYGGSQSCAFHLMNRHKKINSKTFSLLKVDFRTSMMRKANYLDKNLKKIRAYIDDPRVLSGELKHINLGRIHSEETRKKISENSKNCSEETRKKISEKATGRKKSQQTKNKIAESNRRRIYSDETKAKIQKALFDKDSTIYNFFNTKTKQEIIGSRYVFFIKTSINPKHLLKTGKYFDWRFSIVAKN